MITTFYIAAFILLFPLGIAVLYLQSKLFYHINGDGINGWIDKGDRWHWHHTFYSVYFFAWIGCMPGYFDHYRAGDGLFGILPASFVAMVPVVMLLGFTIISCIFQGLFWVKNKLFIS